MKEGTLLSELNTILCPTCDEPVKKMSREMQFTTDKRVEPIPNMQLNVSAITPVVDPSRRASANSAMATVEVIFPDGRYRGVYNQDGVPHGRGTMRFNDGSIYEGEWNNGVMEGQGECTYPDGKGKYTGEWKTGHPNGKGKCSFRNGCEYNGIWKNGAMDGLGVYKFENSEEYDGEWKKNQPDGKGTFKYASGNIYEGQWRKGKREGNGKFTYYNDDEYEGEWCDDKKDGIGVYKRASGEFDIKTYYQDAPQEGVRWNSDKTKAWKLLSGDAVEEISLEEAEVFRNNVCDASPFLAFILR